MWEDVFEIYRRAGDSVCRIASNMSLCDAVLFMRAWMSENYNDQITSLELRRQPMDAESIRCKDCKHYKQSEVADRKMCFRKDVDRIEVCYDFLPNDSCTYGERKDGMDNE